MGGGRDFEREFEELVRGLSADPALDQHTSEAHPAGASRRQDPRARQAARHHRVLVGLALGVLALAAIATALMLVRY